MEQQIRIKQSFTLITHVSVLTVSGLSLNANEMMDESPVLPTTVVSAPRFLDVDLDVASQVQVIDSADITESGATNVVELLTRKANIHFRSTTGNSALSEISMGGFGEGSSQRVLVVLDGHRLNTADLGQINWLSIPISLVESIEVIKGGQSALYGNNAVGGVIKINTKQPASEIQGQAQASAGSFDSYNGCFGVSGSAGPLTFAVHAEHDETDGYRQNSAYEADGASLRLGWNFDNWLNASFSVSGVESEYGLPGPLSQVEQEADRTQSTEFVNGGDEEATYLRGGLSFGLSESLTFLVNAGYTERDLNTVFYYYGFGDPDFPFFIEQEYRIFSLLPVLTYQDERTTATLGLDHYDDEVDAVFGSDPLAYERKTLAGFASIKHAIDEDWVTTGSLRFEEARTDGSYTAVGMPNELDEIADDQFAWSTALIKSFEDEGRVYGSVRRFYRYPATDEITVVDFNIGAASFNPDLEAETGYEVELGADWAFNSLTFGGRVYHQWMKDEIIYSPDASANINLDKTRRYGVDLNAIYQVTETLDAKLNYTWVHAEIDGGLYDGSELPLVPEHKLRLSAEWRPSEPILIALGGTYTDQVYVGSDFDNGDPQLSDYILWDLLVRYQICENFSVFVSAENLTDEEYVSTAFGVDALYPGVGRSGRIGLTWDF
ncbi:TonB-dependent receptor [Puniceicoccaceae bacterium]|nr:TonB-dependent receptor [Puniceicoccaceae bacterium]